MAATDAFDVLPRSTAYGPYVPRATGWVLSADSVDAWNLRLTETPATVVSSMIAGRPDWPTVNVVSGDGVDIITRLVEESDAPRDRTAVCR
jgi:hypothetical protein